MNIPRNPLAVILCLSLSSPVLASDDPVVCWGGEEHSLTALPEGVGSAPRAALAIWAPWVQEHDYELDLSDDGRVLLVTKDGSRRRDRQRALVERAVKSFDELLPPPTRVAAVEASDAPTSPTSYEYSWGLTDQPIDTETAVLIVVRDDEDQALLVDELVRQQDYLKDWAPCGKRQVGFVHQLPLCAAFVERPSGMQEWDPDNELVHRTARLLFMRRFGARVPYWLSTAAAWHVEERLLEDIYCFPHRSEFVWASEHTGWMSDLRRRFTKRGVAPPSIQELAGWERGTYEAQAAKLSFGMLRFFEQEHGQGLSGLVEAMRLHARERCREDLGGGRWRLRTDYQIPAREQQELLEAHLGEDVFLRAAEFLRARRRRR